MCLIDLPLLVNECRTDSEVRPDSTAVPNLLSSSFSVWFKLTQNEAFSLSKNTFFCFLLSHSHRQKKATTIRLPLQTAKAHTGSKDILYTRFFLLLKCGNWKPHLQDTVGFWLKHFHEILVTLKSQKMPNHTTTRCHQTTANKRKKSAEYHKRDTTKRSKIPQIPSCNLPFGQRQQKAQNDIWRRFCSSVKQSL